MALVRTGLRRIANVGEAVRTTAAGLAGVGTHTLRTFVTPSGAVAACVEAAWLAAHLAVYPMGLLREQLRVESAYRTDPLPPVRRSLVVTDVTAAGTPIILLHGIMDNRSVFAVFRRALRRRGFGVVHAINYSLLTGDVRSAARELHGHVQRLLDEAGADRLHIVGHSLGGVIARYYVQRLGGHALVDTLVTLGSPHHGTMTAYLVPTTLGRQLRPGSDVIRELAEPAPDCTTRFLVVWSRTDQLIIPQRNAQLRHPDLTVEHLELRDVGHLSLPINPRTVHWVATGLLRSDERTHPFRVPSAQVDDVASGQSDGAAHPVSSRCDVGDTPPARFAHRP